MRGCMNCKIDIGLQGHWTSDGYRIYRWAKAELAKKYDYKEGEQNA